MARFLVVLLLLTLALAPATAAQPDQGGTRGGTPFAGWFDALTGAWDWLFSWVRSEPRNTGPMLVPSGIQAAPRRVGPMLVPSGITASEAWSLAGFAPPRF